MEQAKAASIIQVTSKLKETRRRASTTMKGAVAANNISSQVSSKDSIVGANRLGASYRVIRELDSQKSGSGIINIQNDDVKMQDKKNQLLKSSTNNLPEGTRRAVKRMQSLREARDRR